jgi:plastocyanin
MKPTKFTLSLSVLALLYAGFFAAAPTGASPPATNPTAGPTTQVSIDNFTFTPATITVAAGTTVTWVNKDDVPHTVTSTTNKFGSEALDTDEKFTQRFDTPGEYPYYCKVHPHMTGKVIVK